MTYLDFSPWVSIVGVTPSVIALSHAHAGRGASRVRITGDGVAAETLGIVALVDIIGQKLVSLLVDLMVGLADSDRADANLVGDLVEELMN